MTEGPCCRPLVLCPHPAFSVTFDGTFDGTVDRRRNERNLWRESVYKAKLEVPIKRDA